MALAAGGISAALDVPSGSGAQNLITAGHLVVEVNHGGRADLSFTNLAPGESSTGDQLVTADMGGVAAADLSMTLSGAADTPFTEHSSLTVRYSDPGPQGSLLAGDTCTPTNGYTHSRQYSKLTDLASDQTISLGAMTSTHDAVCVRFVVTLDQSAGNPVQGKSGGFSMDYTLTQTAAANPVVNP